MELPASSGSWALSGAVGCCLSPAIPFFPFLSYFPSLYLYLFLSLGGSKEFTNVEEAAGLKLRFAL